MTRLAALQCNHFFNGVEDYEENSALKLLIVHELNKIWVNELCSLSSQFTDPDDGDRGDL
jgi:hypothetical protein